MEMMMMMMVIMVKMLNDYSDADSDDIVITKIMHEQ